MEVELYSRPMIIKLCTRFLDDFMDGKFGLAGIVTHPQYLQISRTMRRLIVQRGLPLDVIGNHGRVEVVIDPGRLTPEELARYQRAIAARIASILYGETSATPWPLSR